MQVVLELYVHTVGPTYNEPLGHVDFVLSEVCSVWTSHITV